MERHDIKSLIERCGKEHVSKRLQTQVEHSAGILGHGVGGVHWENSDTAMWAFGLLIKMMGAWKRGVANIKEHKIVFNRVEIPNLPQAFEGFKVLHLSDLHLDVTEGMGAHIARLCSSLVFDIALITGDFRFHTHGNHYPMYKEVEALARSLSCRFGSFGVLGNHDFLEFVPKLEACGIRMLLNESVAIENEGERLWVIGLDDAHYYGVHDYPRAFRGAPEGETKILMIHSPETLEDALSHHADFVLSGHTHGGQVCLPGGFPLWLNANCKSRYCMGAWDFKGMPGYTSRGTGSSGLPLRFNCPPEIVVHHLVSPNSAQ